jgi:ATP-binding cassette subfamily F protein uup
VSILSFHGVSLTLANVCILDKVDWQIKPQDKIALVGRNGAGKSTLLKLLQGDIVPDQGKIQRLNGLRIAGLQQDVPIDEKETVYHFLVKCLGEKGEVLAKFHSASNTGDLDTLAKYQKRMDDLQAWDLLPRIEAMASRLSLQSEALMSELSGGMKRRALLAAALIAAPDLLLLDEPTNHLDVNAIEWLESYIKTYTGSVLVVTHDREFLSQVAHRIVEIDRGQLYRHDCSYDAYLERREVIRASEEKHNALFDKRLAEEEAWIRTGIKARRTRNEGRVRALKAMREEYKRRRAELGQVKGLTFDVARSGNIVLEARYLNYKAGDKTLLKDFNFLLTRGDKVGIIGPNGCGKTTLVRLLLGELTPSLGEVKQGTSLAVAYFDQLRRQLDEQQTVMANVGEGSDLITINGKQKHVATYLREFLFSPERFNQPVSSLSGGERNRLLLAKLFAKPVNLLVMDEPTNDLDIETLELLETMLVDYPGTLLLISHDRAFINHVVSSVLVYEGEGVFNEYVGGYQEYREVKKQQKEPSTKPLAHHKSNSVKLTFNEQRELSELPQRIEQLEAQVALWQSEMAESTFYQQDPDKITDFKLRLTKSECELADLYQRWEYLEEKSGG